MLSLFLNFIRVVSKTIWFGCIFENLRDFKRKLFKFTPLLHLMTAHRQLSASPGIDYDIGITYDSYLASAGETLKW